MGAGFQLSDQQLAFMRVLWDLGEATTAEVHAALVKQGQALAPTTVATVLSRLEKRNLVDHRSRGRQYIYHAKIAEHAIRRSMLARLTDFFFGGDPDALVSHLTEGHGLGEQDLDDVRQMLAEGHKLDPTPPESNQGKHG